MNPSSVSPDLPGTEPSLGATPAIGSATQVYVEPRPDETTAYTPRGSTGATITEPVPGYEILGELGRGAMGVVFKARDQRLNRLVALKMILAGEYARSQEQARFLAEAEAAAALAHPHIVTLFEIGQQRGLPWFTLEFVEGGTLEGRVAQHPLPPAEAARLIEQVARGVGHAHTRGIVHRDLKPGNILLTPDGTPKVTDFGIAKRLDGDSQLTATGVTVGTPSYMAPEQAAGDSKRVGPAADLYALGAILYRLLTGRPPFQAATVPETLVQVVRDDPVPPRLLQPKLQRDLETICLKCLHKEPQRRYATADALADDLERFLKGEPIQARPVPAWERAWKASRRHPAVTALGASAILATVAILAVIVIANARLKQERDLARLAEEAAQHERAKAQSRLELAVGAVDKMMVRVADARWASRPELQNERRQVLADAVAFFAALPEDDSRNPLVRREAARVHLRVATAWFALAEYEKAERSLQTAMKLNEGLTREFPAYPAYIHAQAEDLELLAHIRILSARYAEALQFYQQAHAAADVAYRARPDVEDYRITKALTLMHLGHFHGRQDRVKAASYLTQALALVDEPARQPNAPFGIRLLAALVETNLIGQDMDRNDMATVARRLDRASNLIAALEKEQAPTALLWQLFEQARVMTSVGRAYQAVRLGKVQEGLALMEEAQGLVASQLAMHPRSFPMRLQKIELLGRMADLFGRQKQDTQARACLEELVATERNIIRDTPEMSWITRQTAVARSMLLVLNARETQLDRFEESVRTQLAETMGEEGPTVKYNLACAYAQASRTGSDSDQAARRAQAFKILRDLAKVGYFRIGNRAAYLSKDEDLLPLHGQKEFDQLRAEVTRPPAPSTPKQ